MLMFENCECCECVNVNVLSGGHCEIYAILFKYTIYIFNECILTSVLLLCVYDVCTCGSTDAT